jgi:hypothetical protein
MVSTSLIRFPLLTLMILATGTPSQPAGSAVEQFRDIQASLRQARASGNWSASLADANQLRLFMNDAPDSLLEVARAEVRVGDLDTALHTLNQFAAMGQSTNLPETSEEFAPLRKKEAIASIESQMKTNESPILRGGTAFSLSDAEFLAEDIDHDPETGRFFITSIREKKILATDDKGRGNQFARAPDGWPMLAIKVDLLHKRVWATEVALRDFSIVPKPDWGRSALLCFDLKDGRLLRRIEGPSGSALGDMALTAEGDVIVSDGEGGGVYRIRANGNQMERLDNGDFVSPQTPAIHPDGRHIFVPDYVRGIGVLDMKTKRVQWLSGDGRFALNGIDGMYLYQGVLIAIQNGTSPERVAAFRLNGTLTKVVSEKIIERSTDTLGDPTHGVIVGQRFYYIANSGWDVVDEHGNAKAGATVSSPHIMQVSLNHLG